MDKKISYLARNFDDIKSELISFSKKYYPELSTNFNDASVGSWFIDLMSAVGDDLSYHTDRMYQETDINTSSTKSSILNYARLNGVKVPGPKSSICEIELSCILPIDSTNIQLPNWNYAPLIKRGGIVGNATYTFELTEDVNFKEQFNSDGVSNRTFVPIRDNNGIIVNYKVTKTTLVVSGQSKIFKKVITHEELEPFMEVILPDKNIMEVESIIFKESSNFNLTPQTFEFFIDEEEFRVATPDNTKEDISTYRYFEVNSLADQVRFGAAPNLEKSDEYGLVAIPSLPEEYVDYTEIDNTPNGQLQQTRRYYKGQWKPVVQKFITEYTDNGFLKIIFGPSTDSTEIPINGSNYATSILSRTVNNHMLGLLPKAGWSMFVLYRVGGGLNTNLGQGAINTIIQLDTVFPLTDNNNSPDTIKTQNDIINSITVYNPMSSVAGKDALNTSELKYYVKYSIPSQERCVTLKDYKSRVMQMPSKFGCPFRCNVCEDNNKIIMPLLGLNPLGKLDNTLPQILVNNIITYLSNYKSLTDYIQITNGRIYNIGFKIDVFIDKNYVASDVISNIISTISNYLTINNRDMGEDIFLGDLERLINTLNGVISLISLKVYSITDGEYSDTPVPLPYKINGDTCNEGTSEFLIDGATVNEIDLDATDHVLYTDYDAMYEIKNPLTDIQIRAKIR